MLPKKLLIASLRAMNEETPMTRVQVSWVRAKQRSIPILQESLGTITDFSSCPKCKKET